MVAKYVVLRVYYFTSLRRSSANWFRRSDNTDVIRLRMIRTTTFLILLLSVGCDDSKVRQSASQTGAVELGRDPDTGEVYFALDRSVPDNRGIKFHSSQPFRISLGRGTGMHGLETIEIDENLNAELYRQTDNGWETCVVELTIEEWGAVSDSIAEHDLYALDRAYHAKVADGTQWILWVRQNGNAKTVYCNNYFPDPLRSFARDIDSLFDIDDDLLEWTAVPFNLAGDHDETIWDAIKDR